MMLDIQNSFLDSKKCLIANHQKAVTNIWNSEPACFWNKFPIKNWDTVSSAFSRQANSSGTKLHRKITLQISPPHKRFEKILEMY